MMRMDAKCKGRDTRARQYLCKYCPPPPVLCRKIADKGFDFGVLRGFHCRSVKVQFPCYPAAGEIQCLSHLSSLNSVFKLRVSVPLSNVTCTKRLAHTR